VIVLAFLWLAFVLLSIAALVAIVFNERYPRSIFDFNLGVLRWTWRVAFYSYSALGTDRYPPFTLADVDYPARLHVDYPERLSRGKALVKWWLLAIPQYLVIGIFAGGWGWGWAPGLIGVLVLIAAFAVMFTEEYPPDIFDLVIGLNRWAFRVVSYAALMRDEYPPFRLDMGPSEPPAAAADEPSSPPPGSPAVDAGGARWRRGRHVSTLREAAEEFLAQRRIAVAGVSRDSSQPATVADDDYPCLRADAPAGAAASSGGGEREG
jgi:hypothetical protein